MNEETKRPGYRFFNRELSWLGFNDRVLDQAHNLQNPLLERLKFLAISAKNLDEFFRVRIGSLKFADQRGSQKTGIAGMSVSQQLVAIRERVKEMNQRQSACFLEGLLPEMKSQGIRRLTNESLSPQNKSWLRENYVERIRNLLEHRAAGKGQGFPWLNSSRVCLLVRFEGGEGILPHLYQSSETGGSRFMVLELPDELKRIVNLPGESGYSYVLIEDLVAELIEELFPQEKIAERIAIRVIRNADFELNEEAGDFFQEMEQLLELREASSCVRLEISEIASPETVEFLKKVLGITAAEVYSSRGPLDLGDFMVLSGIPGYSTLKYPPWQAAPSPEFLSEEPAFDIIAEKDRLLVHPFQSYDPVLQFLEQASRDPQVLAIKQTLYRTSRDSRIVQTLIHAANNGKRVTVVVELKARFDEARNMSWAQSMERAGITVIYGVRGLKTHAKLCLVVRDEPTGIRRYAHVATGNYNESTATLYGDISLFTADPQITGDILNAFNSITGLTVPQPMEKVAMAPVNLRSILLEHIRVEKENAIGGVEAQISAKLNSLVDAEVIDALYDASCHGVIVRLNVRGICCLRPGVPGLSENIRVTSIVDRYLEHARIIQFRQSGENRMFIASADWMTRNLDQRIELMVPVEDPSCKQRLEQVLEFCFRDNVNSWDIRPDGSAVHNKPGRRKPFRAQQELWQWFQQQYLNATNPGTTVFKPIYPE